MKRTINLIIVFILLLLKLPVFGQVAEDTYVVYFNTKEGTPYTLDNPLDYLSQRSLDRRTKSQISIDSTDLPVNPAFLDSIEWCTADVLYTSKWFNFAVIDADPADVQSILNFSFVKNIKQNKITQYKKTKDKFPKNSNSFLKRSTQYENEYMLTQINITPLFDLGLSGAGVRIAVIDAGFRFLNQCSSFSHVFSDGRVIATKNFVNNSSVFETHYHGANVTSIMGGMLEDYHGLAPGAEYVLIQSENGSSEDLVEEYNWVAAAEYADSIGADIINSSLGYSEFDWPEQNHTISDMDGNTTIISRAAGVAFQKGMLVVTSAGNEGTSSWRYITAPADQPLALTVGSVDSQGNLSAFSGVGLPSNQYKPNVVACGEGASYVFSSQIGQGNGTSYSSPVIAGAAATLWESFPDKTNQEIFDAIIQSCSSYPSGDNYTGYGIPNFARALIILNGSQILPESLTSKDVLSTYSDAEHNLHLHIYTPENDNCEIFIYDMQQQLLGHKKTTLSGMSTNHITISDLGASATAQLLLVRVQLPGFEKTVKVFMF